MRRKDLYILHTNGILSVNIFYPQLVEPIVAMECLSICFSLISWLSRAAFVDSGHLLKISMERVVLKHAIHYLSL